MFISLKLIKVSYSFKINLQLKDGLAESTPDS
jgi:hypothetical protein